MLNRTRSFVRLGTACGHGLDLYRATDDGSLWHVEPRALWPIHLHRGPFVLHDDGPALYTACVAS